MFAECSNLTQVDLGLKAYMDGTTAVRAFANCKVLKKVNLSNLGFISDSDGYVSNAVENMFLLNHDDPSLDVIGNEVIDTIIVDE